MATPCRIPAELVWMQAWTKSRGLEGKGPCAGFAKPFHAEGVKTTASGRRAATSVVSASGGGGLGGGELGGAGVTGLSPRTTAATACDASACDCPPRATSDTTLSGVKPSALPRLCVSTDEGRYGCNAWSTLAAETGLVLAGAVAVAGWCCQRAQSGRSPARRGRMAEAIAGRGGLRHGTTDRHGQKTAQAGTRRSSAPGQNAWPRVTLSVPATGSGRAGGFRRRCAYRSDIGSNGSSAASPMQNPSTRRSASRPIFCQSQLLPTFRSCSSRTPSPGGPSPASVRRRCRHASGCCRTIRSRTGRCRSRAPPPGRGRSRPACGRAGGGAPAPRVPPVSA